jgi:SAM-dependent methyltransferase
MTDVAEQTALAIRLATDRTLLEAELAGSRAATVAPDLSSAYYQDVHETNPAYQTNSWLVPETERILAALPRSILEVGCGNGRFLAAVAGRVDSVTGVDWARSPHMVDLPANATFRQCDVTRDELPSADLVCSGDVLEHFDPDRIRAILARIHAAGRFQYHVIACYHDNHSHLTIAKPGVWLALFRENGPGYRIRDVTFRKNNRDRPICIIANF